MERAILFSLISLFHTTKSLLNLHQYPTKFHRQRYPSPHRTNFHRQHYPSSDHIGFYPSHRIDFYPPHHPSHHIDFYPSDHPHHADAHCDPNTKELQVCPSGAHCRPAYLDCVLSTTSRHDSPAFEYCICPSHHDNSIPPQRIDMRSRDSGTRGETHCDPNAAELQVCPSGAHCHPTYLDCVLSTVSRYNSPEFEYCICPSHHDHNIPPHRIDTRSRDSGTHGETHCDPNAAELQVCPNGAHCHPTYLDCVLSTVSRYNSPEFEYCICPSHHDHITPPQRIDPRSRDSGIHGETHCDPNAAELQVCPNGAHCHPSHLDCVLGTMSRYNFPVFEYCICPFHHDHSISPQHIDPRSRDSGTHSETHCDPNAAELQVCPSGAHCHPSHLDCVLNTMSRYNPPEFKYCICPSHHDHSTPPQRIDPRSRGSGTHGETHCDPNAAELQVCPNGAHCHPAYLDCSVTVASDHISAVYEYCICPHHPHEHGVHYPIDHGNHQNRGIHYPIHHGNHFNAHETHCDPNSLELQICPNGAHCHPAYLECETHNGRLEYCIC